LRHRCFIEDHVEYSTVACFFGALGFLGRSTFSLVMRQVAARTQDYFPVIPPTSPELMPMSVYLRRFNHRQLHGLETLISQIFEVYRLHHPPSLAHLRQK